MEFEEIKEIASEYIDLNLAKINYFRECIKNFEINEIEETKLKEKIPEPWYLGECPDDNKPAIYNLVAEIIDDVVMGQILTQEKIDKLNLHKNITHRLIEMRKNKINRSKNNITKDKFLLLPVIGSSEYVLNQIESALR